MTSSQLKILITGVGAPGTKGTIHCIQNSHLPPLRLIGVDLHEGAAGKALVDEFYTVPPPESPSYFDRIQEICILQDVDLILPQTTREVAALSSLREKLHAPVLVASREAIELANHKGRLLEVFKQHHLPHPTFHLAQSLAEIEEAALQLGYPDSPVVIKPPCSSGMRGFRILTEKQLSFERFITEKPLGIEMPLRELLRIYEGAPSDFEVILSEYLPGDEFSVDALLNENHEVALVRRRNQIRTGISFVTTVEPHPELEKVVIEAGKLLGLTHLYGMQFKEDKEGHLKLLECNPRVQGTMAATLSAGVNLIAHAISDALDLPSPPLTKNSASSSFYRYWGGAFQNEGACHVF